MIDVEIRLLEVKCPPSFCVLSLWVDDNISYCWAPFSADYQKRENRSLRLPREEAGLPLPLLTDAYTCFPYRKVSEIVFPRHQLAVGIWKKCLIVFPVKLSLCWVKQFSPLLLPLREDLLSGKLHPPSFCFGINCLVLFSTFPSLKSPDSRGRCLTLIPL